MVVSSQLERFFTSIPDRPAQVPLPDGSAVLFQIRGEGGGTWTVARRRGRLQVERGITTHPDCRLSCSARDFHALLRGELDPREGFLDGRLELEGDVGLVLRLHRLAG